MPSSPTFGFPVSGNNAPLPMFGSQTNPTGGPTAGGGSTFPSFPMFGTPSAGTVTPTANLPVFGGSTGGLQDLSSGFGLIPGGNQYGKNIYDMLGKAYGKGTGQLLGNMITQGLFNPQIAAAFLNAMQPGIQRGEANILNAFGAEGARFGSAAQLGIGDYLSQVNLNEQQTLASMFMQAQQEQLGLLENVLPTIQKERANQGSWLHTLLGGLEIAGGLIGAPFTGGMSLGLVGGGVNQLGQGLGGGGSSSGGGGGGSLFGLPGFGGNTGTFGMGAPSLFNFGGSSNNLNDWMTQGIIAGQEASAASSLLGDIPAVTGQ